MPLALQTPTAVPGNEPAIRPSFPDSASSNDRQDGSPNVTALVNQVLAELSQHQHSQRLPTATYRVQLNALCTFQDVRAVVPYLHALGISDLYASPFLEARPGSLHGYDIVNHAKINPQIGSREDLCSLRAALRDFSMGLIADVVPNHMSNSPRLNGWWEDVLENGQSSPYASYFDIDWSPRKPDLENKVLLPVLGDQFGKVLEDGQLVVRYDGGAFWLEYFDHRFPLAPRSYAVILSCGLEDLRRQLGEQHPDLQELLSILTCIKNLPRRTETRPDLLEERRREKEVNKRRLNELVGRSPDIASYVSACLRHLNGQPGEPRSFDQLDELLQIQAYRLAYWRVASDEINYRRFFDINELAAICTEHPPVFAETHRLLLELLDDGTLTGLRIDHPDGLYDPRGYFCQLQEQQFLGLCRRALALRGDLTAGQREVVEQRLQELWHTALPIPGSPLSRLLYVVVEKILAPGEELPENWPVFGTVGYEFLNAVNGLFVAPSGERPLSALYTRFTGNSLDFRALANQCKRLIVKLSMASELHMLSFRLDRISERNRWTRDFTLNSLRRALQEVIAWFSVYRTYVSVGPAAGGSGAAKGEGPATSPSLVPQVLERDVYYVRGAVARAKRSNPAMSSSIFDFVQDVLLLRFHHNADDEERMAIQEFVGKFQQLTGPIMAKAVEDTAFYRFNRLVSLNEVGGDPAKFGTRQAEFHQLNAARLRRFTHTLNATTTHDTKRSEDVRARINVLSENGSAWREHVQRWSRSHRRLKTNVEGNDAPSRNSEYLLYQTLVGVWPGEIPTGQERTAFVARIQQYMLKVVREAKVNTSWISPHEAYEAALERFISGVFDDDRRRPFLAELNTFCNEIARHGCWNSLAQLVLKIGSPGVPDFYQGTEVWSYTLVDPDNRRPVDFRSLNQSLDQLRAAMAEALGEESRGDVVDDWFSSLAGSDAGTKDFLRALLQPVSQEATLPAGQPGDLLKLFATQIALRTRRRLSHVFTAGEYLPLPVTGRYSDHLVAFARWAQDRAVLVVVPRLTVSVSGFGGPPPLGELWKNTVVEIPEVLPSGPWRNCFTRETLAAASRWPVADVLRCFPVALFVNER